MAGHRHLIRRRDAAAAPLQPDHGRWRDPRLGDGNPSNGGAPDRSIWTSEEIMARTDIVIDDYGHQRPRRMLRILLCLIGAFLSLSTAAPRAQAPHEWPTFSIRSAPAELRPSIQYGDLIILSIQNAVLSELVRELTDAGPEHAIRVCHMSATTVANRIAHEEG